MALVDREAELPNRRHLGVFLDAAFGAAERGGRVAVVLFGLDAFSVLADARGRGGTGAVLRVLTPILSEQTWRVDLTARFGAEQFVSVLTGADAAEARAFAERVRQALRAEPFPWGRVTVSAGIACPARGLVSPDVLLAEADRALHHAVDAGGDRVFVWEPGARGRKDLAAVPGPRRHVRHGESCGGARVQPPGAGGARRAATRSA